MNIGELVTLVAAVRLVQFGSCFALSIGQSQCPLQIVGFYMILSACQPAGLILFDYDGAPVQLDPRNASWNEIEHARRKRLLG